jgi:hypothetical protein
MGPADVKVTLYPTGAEIAIDQGRRILWRARYSVNTDRLEAGYYNEAVKADRKSVTEFSIRTLAAYYVALMEGVE